MKKDQGKDIEVKHRNGHRNPNSPRLTAFDSNEEIEREIKKKARKAKTKKTDSKAEKPKKKNKKSGNEGTDHRAN